MTNHEPPIPRTPEPMAELASMRDSRQQAHREGRDRFLLEAERRPSGRAARRSPRRVAWLGLAAGLAFLVWLGSPWGDAAAVTIEGVRARAAEVQDVVFRTRVVVYKEDGEVRSESRGRTFMSAKYGLRDESFWRGESFTTEILSLEDEAWLTLFHSDGRVKRKAMKPGERERMATEVSPAVWVSRLLARSKDADTKRLGESEVEGRRVTGFEWRYPSGGSATSLKVIRLFVDVETLLLVQLVEELHDTATGRVCQAEICESFEWDGNLASQLFAAPEAR